jgi:hypothetical protein
MAVHMGISLDVRLVPIPGIFKNFIPSPLGLLAPLPGKWVGGGFNTIFRPHNSGLDNFLELNLTSETLEFTEIPGEIPNRGMRQADISLFGMTYVQQVADVNVKDTHGNPAGIHIEPGIWVNVPPTTTPAEGASVARLANIPHGTALLAQGTATVVSGPPSIPSVDITPFFTGNPAAKVPFASQTLSNPLGDPDRSPPADIVGITQAMVTDPNSVLRSALVGKTINSHTRIDITTSSASGLGPNAGGGTLDIAFLEGIGSPLNANARVPLMTATFWISDYTDSSGHGTLLQYSQNVILRFNGLDWPHVSVSNLIKQNVKLKEIKEIWEHKALIKENIKFEIEVIQQPQFPPIPDPGPLIPIDLHASPAAAAPVKGRAFILAEERPGPVTPPRTEGGKTTGRTSAAAKKAPAKKAPAKATRRTQSR